MLRLTAERRHEWTTVELDDPTLDGDRFSILVVDVVDEVVRARAGLPPPRLLGRAAPQGFAVFLDSHRYEAVIPVVDGTGTSSIHVVATPIRVVVASGDAPIELDEVRRRMAWDAEHPSVVAVFLVAELALRSFRTEIHRIRTRLDEVEERLLDDPDRDQLLQLNGLHRRISALRRDLGVYADAVVDANDQLQTGLPLPEVAARLARAHAVAAAAVLQALSVVRDEVANTMELHRSLTSARQGAVINRLTVISTLILPLTFVTGFFGMNFGWLTTRVDSAAAFWLLGVAIPTVTAVVVIFLMRRAGWLLIFGSGRGSRTGRR